VSLFVNAALLCSIFVVICSLTSCIRKKEDALNNLTNKLIRASSFFLSLRIFCCAVELCGSTIVVNKGGYKNFQKSSMRVEHDRKIFRAERFI